MLRPHALLASVLFDVKVGIDVFDEDVLEDAFKDLVKITSSRNLPDVCDLDRVFNFWDWSDPLSLPEGWIQARGEAGVDDICERCC